MHGIILHWLLSYPLFCNLDLTFLTGYRMCLILLFHHRATIRYTYLYSYNRRFIQRSFKIRIYVKCQNRCRLFTTCIYSTSNREKSRCNDNYIPFVIRTFCFTYERTEHPFECGCIASQYFVRRNRQKVNLKNCVSGQPVRVMLRYERHLC